MKNWISFLINFYILYITFVIVNILWQFFVFFKYILGVSLILPGDFWFPIPFWIVSIFQSIKWFVLLLASVYFKYSIAFLLWIFVHWMIIKYIIPKWWFVFIPFTPFIIPIPLRDPLLNYIPPFKDLTDAGLLPLMEKMLFLIISDISVKSKLGNGFDYIMDYLENSIKHIIKELFPNFNIENEFKKLKMGNNYEPELPKQDNGLDLTEEQQNTLKDKYNDDYYKIVLQTINIETENCINKNTIPITPDMNYIEKKSISLNNEGLKLKCQAESISSYIRANY